MPLVHEGINPHIARHVASIPTDETGRVKSLNDTEPSGVLAVSHELDPDRTEGSELTYLHGVATTAASPKELDVIDVPTGTWAVFRTEAHTRLPCRTPGRRRPRRGSVPALALASGTRDRGDARLRCPRRDGDQR